MQKSSLYYMYSHIMLAAGCIKHALSNIADIDINWNDCMEYEMIVCSNKHTENEHESKQISTFILLFLVFFSLRIICKVESRGSHIHTIICSSMCNLPSMKQESKNVAGGKIELLAA